MDDEALAAFMDVTGCGSDEAIHRLASCDGHLGEAVNRFFNDDAGTSSGIRRSPPTSPQLISSDSDSDSDYAASPRAPAPAPARRLPELRKRGGGATGGVARGRSSPPSGSSPKVSKRRESDTATGGSGRRSKKKKRRVGDDVDGPYRGRGGGEVGGGRKNSRRRRRQFRVDMFASSSDEEEEKTKVEVEAANTSRRQRRRLNPKDAEEEVQDVTTTSRPRRSNRVNNVLTAVGGEKKSEDGSLRRRYPESVFSFGSDDDMDLAEIPPPSPSSASAAEKDALFRVPHGLAYKCGSLQGAKVQAARRRRWLLVNVQSLEMASLVQNRDVWGSDLVAQCVRDHFVLWQADAGDVDGDGGGEVRTEAEQEARKVLGFYKVPLDRLPVVVFVDAVTGEAVDRLHGTDPNDFLVSIGPYTDKKPEFPVFGAAAKKSIASAAAQQSNQKPPAPTTTAPTSRQEQAAPAAGEKVCKMRVRLPDGRVVEKEFGSQRAVAALFAYCRSELGAEKPLRLLHFVGVSREEIGDEEASFESLGLHMSTACVQLG
ncbi:unnamed protein product [Urochloa humidicola]